MVVRDVVRDIVAITLIEPRGGGLDNIVNVVSEMDCKNGGGIF